MGGSKKLGRRVISTPILNLRKQKTKIGKGKSIIDIFKGLLSLG